jgi:hypothetical protein
MLEEHVHFFLKEGTYSKTIIIIIIIIIIACLYFFVV